VRFEKVLNISFLTKKLTDTHFIASIPGQPERMLFLMLSQQSQNSKALKF